MCTTLTWVFTWVLEAELGFSCLCADWAVPACSAACIFLIWLIHVANLLFRKHTSVHVFTTVNIYFLASLTEVMLSQRLRLGQRIHGLKIILLSKQQKVEGTATFLFYCYNLCPVKSSKLCQTVAKKQTQNQKTSPLSTSGYSPGSSSLGTKHGNTSKYIRIHWKSQNTLGVRGEQEQRFKTKHTNQNTKQTKTNLTKF